MPRSTERYRARPEFYRAIADHIAGMTDSYCNAEYKELVTGLVTGSFFRKGRR